MLSHSILKPKKLFLLFAWCAGLIAIILFFSRFLIPDMSFDTMLYHTFNGYRGLRNGLWPFSNAEFFPVGFGHFPTLYQSLHTLFIETLGYRLGTVASLVEYLILIVLTFKIAYRMAPEFIEKAPLLAGFLTFNALAIMHIYFSIATYYVDITNTTVLAAGFFFFIKFLQETDLRPKKIPGAYLLSHVFFGIALAGKLISGFFVAPFFVVSTWVLFKKIDCLAWQKWLFIVCATLLVSGPVGIHAFRTFELTGNPLFPFFNTLFHSPYLADISIRDNKIGGKDLLQMIFWPLSSMKDPQRLSAFDQNVINLKLPAYFLMTLASIALSFTKHKPGRQARILAGILLISTLLWSLLSGNLRYFIFGEWLGGLLVLVLAGEFFSGMQRKEISGFVRNLGIALTCLICGFFLIQDIRLIRAASHSDLSGRIPYFADPVLHREQLPYLFDKRMRVQGRLADKLAAADVNLVCHNSLSGYYPLFGRKDLPTALIARRKFKHLASNENYKREVRKRLNSGFSGTRDLSFITISVPIKGGIKGRLHCQSDLKEFGALITRTFRVNDFLGYQSGRHQIIHYGLIDRSGSLIRRHSS